MPHTVQVVRDDITSARTQDMDLGILAQGSVRLKIESFAVTANNVTYAVSGDRFGYWNFFPVEAQAADKWGVVPMWGHAVVEQSNYADITEGERVYGYLPMGTHLDVVPGKISAGSFMDMAEHRQPMSPIYNQYTRLTSDPEHNADHEAERMIFAPLFKTGFLIEGFFRREKWFGAQAVILTSASSKTAMGLASVAKDLSLDIQRIGLTSAGNVAFVEETGLYDSVVSYDAIGELPQTASVSVDFAGNASVLRSVHTHLGDALKYSCLVGATHIDARGGGARDIPGPEPILFFAPHHAVAAIKEVGAEAFGKAVATSWHRFLKDVQGTVTMDHRSGIEAAREAFVEMAGGSVDPAQGIVIEP